MLGAGVLTACSKSQPESDAATPTTTTTTEPDVTTTTALARSTVVAKAEVNVLDIFDSVDAPASSRQLDRRTEVTGNLVFVVETQATSPDGRHQVALPVRPNGSTGWVRASDVSLTSHDYAIEVRLADHELILTKAGEVLVSAPIAVGTTDTPTPGGTYYIKELLQPPTPDGPYGTYAYGLSGFSNVLESFAGGNGVIGIHGTNAPESVGTDVSAGCIRLTNDVINRLVEEIGLPLGVPVRITA